MYKYGPVSIMIPLRGGMWLELHDRKLTVQERHRT
jgi:hypothetical protein